MKDKATDLCLLYGEVCRDPAFAHLKTLGSRFVPGEGSPLPARIAFVGEAPGAVEDKEGRPFMGPSGVLLGDLLADVGLERPRVFITNVLKYRPPGNRAPTPEEVAAAKPYIERELDIVGPQIVVLLGRTALNTFFPHTRVGMVHGRPINRNRRIYLPAYHPSAALRGSDARQAINDDFAMLGQLLGVRTLARR